MNIEDTEQPTRRRGIQSVEIGLRVLDALAGLGKASPLGVIAEASGLSSPQAHRYLASLMVSGMTRQDGASGRYDLGPAALRLGLGALARIDAFQVADVAIGDYVTRTGRTVQIAALGPMGPTIVRWHMGRPAVMTSFNVGSVLPLLHSATGHVFLTFRPERETEAVLVREMAADGVDGTAVDAIRARVQAAGRADVAGTMIPGLRATACPIFDLQGRAILSATALAPNSLPADGDEAALADLVATCGEISSGLGWQTAKRV